MAVRTIIVGDGDRYLPINAVARFGRTIKVTVEIIAKSLCGNITLTSCDTAGATSETACMMQHAIHVPYQADYQRLSRTKIPSNKRHVQHTAISIIAVQTMRNRCSRTLISSGTVALSRPAESFRCRNSTMPTMGHVGLLWISGCTQFAGHDAFKI